MYYSKGLSFCFLAAILFGCAVHADQSSVSLHIFGSSSTWWVAVQPQNDNGATSQIWVKDASSDFVQMEHNPDWGYYAASSLGANGFNPPLTFRLTSSSGAQLTAQMDSIAPDTILDTGAQFGASGSPAAAEPEPAESSPVEPEPAAPAPDVEVEQPAPAEDDTPAPAAPANEEEGEDISPSNPDLCSVTSTSEEPLKIMVPLYVYPGAAWDALIDAASSVKIIAVINPNSGPLPTVDSSYSTYMTKLHDAGIEIIGYVHTTYGERSISDVQADVDTYVTNYPLVTGIFFDEAANDASQLSYYTQAYNFVMSKGGYNQVILNPGVQPDQGYLDISTNIVIFENYASSLAGTSFDSWVTCAPNASQKSGWKYRFSGIAHTATADIQASTIASLADKGMGLVYVTDGAGGCCTYNELVTYFANEASSVQALN